MNTSTNLMAVRIREKRLENGYTQEELGKLIGTKRAAVNKYESGQVENMKRSTIEKLSNIFNVSPTWLMGFDVPMNSVDPLQRDLSEVSNIILPQAVRVPIIGSIAAGSPILAEENIEEYLYLDKSLKIDFCLKVLGDSMIDAGIYDGDIALLKKQSTLENGEIGAVIIDNEATLKKVYISDNSLVLQPCNKNYEPLIVKEDVNTYIAGKLVGVIHKY